MRVASGEIEPVTWQFSRTSREARAHYMQNPEGRKKTRVYFEMRHESINEDSHCNVIIFIHIVHTCFTKFNIIVHYWV